MSKQTEWLFAEIERWRRELIVTPDQAGRIRALYAEEHRVAGPTMPEMARAPAKPKQSAPWGLIVFSGLGAVVVGLGVILLLAYNWDKIHKFGKLGLIFGAIGAAHGAGLWLRGKDGWRPGLGEVFSLLGSMLFGAGIWLVAQVYHIDEHFPNGFMIWGLGALALAWVLVSIPQALLATVTLTIWGCAETFAFDAPNNFALALVLFGVGPLVWRKQSVLLAAVVLAAVYVLILANIGFWYGGSGVHNAAFSLSVLLIALVRAGEVTRLSEGIRGVLTFFGWTGFLICTYVLSFHDAVESLLKWPAWREPQGVGVWLFSWGLFALAALAWLWLLAEKIRGTGRVKITAEMWLCPIALIYSQGMAIAGYYGDPQFVSIIFNLVILGLATAWMVRGCRSGSLGPVVLGSVVFAALVFARYFDLFESLAVRGVVFLVLGGVLFAEGFFYRRMRQVESGEGGTP